MYIKEIHIRNFRSIVKADIPLNQMSIFVGYNDVGKSNVLKALNLFFNNETDFEKGIFFEGDYSKHAIRKNKKADEITIELIFNAPKNYAGSKDISWTKVWRKTGFYREGEKITFTDGTLLPPKTKLYAWLFSIRFSYIPAIRDNSYFQLLLAKLHDSLAETIDVELRDAGDEFIKKIKNNTGLMIREINSRLKINSQIRLPSNLQALFRTLDFSTNEAGFEISLANRGDGIKTRHIPIILKFISEQLNINRRRGAINVNMIWGYEEPENNLEMIAAFNLAEEFLNYSNKIQILITTHSPGFYTLKKSYPEKINLFKVIKQKGKEAEIKMMESYMDLDIDMGIMPIVAPYVKEKVDEIKKLESDINGYKEELTKVNNNVIFVEGDDEVRIFTEILNKLNKNTLASVSKDGLGCTGVKNQLMAWSWVSSVSKYKAVGVFDNDNSGTSALKYLKNDAQFQSSQLKNEVKAVQYKAPQHLIHIKKAIGSFPIELEEMYPLEIWEIADAKGWLEDREINELNSFVVLDSAKQTIDEKINSLGLSKGELLYVNKKVPDKHKDKLSKYIILDNSLSFENKLQPIIRIFIETIIPFLEQVRKV